MRTLLDQVGLRALHRLDPETAHELSLAALRCGLAGRHSVADDPRLAVVAAGLRFPNPIGLAAGYDKNGEVADALLALGFGFVEIGTVTPVPQAGNPRPRIFRLSQDRAIINRLGFNNRGHAAMTDRLKARRGRPGIVGVNIGANKDSADRMADYEAGARRFAPLAAYLTVNISSPNTPGLRDLQSRAALAELLARVCAARDAAGTRTPVFLKIAPDLTDGEAEDIAGEVRTSAVAGVIVSNTTTARQGLASPQAGETGGMSGRPLFARSTALLARMRRLLGPGAALVGVGGVDSAQTALEKIRAGADLVQLYSSMIYEGPGLAARIVAEMGEQVAREGVASLRELRDSRTDHWADRPLGA